MRNKKKSKWKRGNRWDSEDTVENTVGREGKHAVNMAGELNEVKKSEIRMRIGNGLFDFYWWTCS